MRSGNYRNRHKLTRLRLENLEARRLMSVYADFDGDGFDDMAIGVPFEDVGSVTDAGAVHVLYGASSGLSTTGTQLWTQNSKFIVDDAETDDAFGSALASGDFNNDGFADLAIGVPGESIGAVNGAGAVHVLYGSASGLGTSGNQMFHQDTPRVREFNEPDDRWGTTLATGDINGDGFSDVIIGAPNESVGVSYWAGSISVLIGGQIGISPVGNQTINLDTGSMLGTAADHDRFGSSLTVGDFNNDGRDDVAIGIPDKDIDDGIGVAQYAGAVSVVYGSTTGLTTSGNQFWHEGIAGISSTPFEWDRFGSSVAAGDFNADGRDDLAIGVPFEIVGISVSAGAVHVMYGSNGGITVTGEQFFDQNDAAGEVEHSDYFGRTLAAADFNGDGRSDLAIGATDERVGLLNDAAGCVNIMYGSASGLSSSGAFEVTQESLGTGAQSEFEDRFGEGLGAGDFNGNGRADLVISAPREDLGAAVDAGHAWTLYGTTSGFTSIQSWSQDTVGMPDVSESEDQFGYGLDIGGGRSSGGGSGRRDLAHLISADFELDSWLTKPNKRRLLGSRR